MGVMQQFEVAVLGFPASRLIDLLAERLQPSPFSMKPNVQPPQAYTATLMAVPPTSVLVVGLTSYSSSSVPSIGEMTETHQNNMALSPCYSNHPNYFHYLTTLHLLVPL